MFSMKTHEITKAYNQENDDQYTQRLLSRFDKRESAGGETAQDLVLEIIGGGKGRKGKTTKRQVAVAARLLVSALHHNPDYRMRATAARMLGELPFVPRMERALIKALRDPSVRVRGCAAGALGQHRCTNAVQPLLNLLTGEESDKARRRATKGEERPWWLSEEEYCWLDYMRAIEALGRLGDQKAVEPLLAFLRRVPPHIYDPEEFRRSLESPPSFSFSWEERDEPVWHKHIIRVQLMEALGNLADTRATQTLCELLADSYGNISCAAARALKGIHDRSAIDPLINSLPSSYVDLNREIRNTLRSFEDDELIEKLLTKVAALSRDYKQLWRSHIIPFLGELQATKAIEPMLTMLSSTEEPELRESLIWTLGKLGASQAREPLYLLLQEFDGPPQTKDRYDTNLSIYRALFRTLAQLGDERVLDSLLQALHHEDSFIRSEAIDGLTVIDNQRALEELLSLLRNWKPGESKYHDLFSITSDLIKLGDKRASGPLCELLITLNDLQKYQLDRSKIVTALGTLGDKSAVKLLITVFQQETAPGSASATATNPFTAEHSAESLGNLGDPQACKPLIAYLKNRSHIRWDVASYVIEALGKLGDPAALPAIKWTLRFDSDKILELPPKARWKYRVYEIKETAQMAINRITEARRGDGPSSFKHMEHSYPINDLADLLEMGL